jgi:hypothetical protein
MTDWSSRARQSCERGVLLTCKHLTVVGCIAYFLIMAWSYGIIAGGVERRFDKCMETHKYSFECGDAFDRNVGPFIGATIWPIYWPFHIAYLLNR